MRMRVLSVISSTNQMYSGIGRNVFELAARSKDRVEMEFAVDDHVARNAELVVRFGRDHGIPVHVGRVRTHPDTLDVANDDLPGLLASGRWDAVECLGWANAASNGAVLDEIGSTLLVYTPHHQPTWTVPMSEAQAARVEDVHLRMLRRADVVLCDSDWERRWLRHLAGGRDNGRYVPLGCDFERFKPGSLPRREQLLFVGDLAETRKRFDRVIEVFGRLLAARPKLRLVVIGNKSNSAIDLVPPRLRHAIDLRGYVDEDELLRAYRESRGLFLLSDFEAFGIPILEALASGTPVFLNRQEALLGLFGPFWGARFCPAEDIDATTAIVEETLAMSHHAMVLVSAERTALRMTFDWPRLADRKWEAMAGAWFARRGWAMSA